MTKLCYAEMILFNAGLCNCTGDSFVVDNNTQYQFRIQLSRAPSYCCINAGDFTNQLIELLSPASSTLDWYHEESNQIITDSNANLCPSDNNTSTFLSPILQNQMIHCNVTVTHSVPTTLLISLLLTRRHLQITVPLSIAFPLHH